MQHIIPDDPRSPPHHGPPVTRRSLSAGLGFDLFQLGLESQAVIGLRLAKAMMGGDLAGTEAHRMVSEKAKAAFDAQRLVATSMMSGRGDQAPALAVAMLRRRVRANRRRLARGG